jgi:hypothetical protein
LIKPAALRTAQGRFRVLARFPAIVRIQEPTMQQASPLAPPCLQFYRMIGQARAPQRADRAAAGTLPTRAVRYCDAVTSAAGFGWYVFPPMRFSVLWDGADIFWTHDGIDQWRKLDAVQFPAFDPAFDAAVPEEMRGYAPPFLTALPEPGTVQIWTGLLMRSAPGWSVLVRPPVNLPPLGGCSFYEGIVATDCWFGPLITNLRLTRTDVPVTFDADMPLLQVQPLPRAVLELTAHTPVDLIDLPAFATREWTDYHRNIVGPNKNAHRAPGTYAVAARRRRAGQCPHEAHVEPSLVM